MLDQLKEFFANNTVTVLIAAGALLLIVIALIVINAVKRKALKDTEKAIVEAECAKATAEAEQEILAEEEAAEEAAEEACCEAVETAGPTKTEKFYQVTSTATAVLGAVVLWRAVVHKIMKD